MNFLRTTFFFLVFLFILLACAKQSTPTGGPKDSIPPILVKSIPGHKQVNFKSKKIELTFSETVILNNPKEQIIITPTIGKNFKATNKNKAVTLEFENEFKDSTTYTLNFREAIQDITEKNSARNLQLAFSTGTYIDSLSITGSIYDLQTTKETKDGTVALYEKVDTFNIFKHKPVYITKTDDKGQFKLENLKNGKYYIYAFEDKNKNLIVDSKNESYGFLNDTITLTKNISKISIPIQHLDARALKLTSARPYNNYFNIKTSKNIISYELTSDSTPLISAFGEDRANIRVYNFIKKDSLATKLIIRDSIGNSVDTTFYVKFSKKKSEPEKFATAIDDLTISEKEGILKTKIVFNKPIATINFDSLLFLPDSTTVIKFTQKDLEWDYPTNTVSIRKTIEKQYLEKEKVDATKKEIKAPQSAQANTTKKKTVKNEVIFGKGAFISIDGDSSKNKTQSFKILREEDAGIILVSIKTDEKYFITELVTPALKVLQSVKNTKNFKLENLVPASYLLRLTIDKNGNGKWDPGNFFTKEEPEPILYYRNEKKESQINLKANWELGPLLITY